MNMEIEMQYQSSHRYVNAGDDIDGDQNRAMTTDEFQEAKQEAHWDIAWQIFDEINEKNDTDKQIDFHCLSIGDSHAICKQKIYDVALLASKDIKKRDFILSIMTNETHI